MHAREIDIEVVAAVGVMPQPVRHADTLAMIRTVRDADRIAVAIRLLSTVHPTFADPRQLRAATASGDLRRIVVGAITRVSAPLPQGPVLAGFRRLTTTNELRIKARQFRNCLDQPFMSAACLGGQRSVYEVADQPVVVEIGRIDAKRWVLLGINGVGNKRLPDHVRGTIAARLWRQGIERCGGPLVACEWDVFAALADELRGEDVPSLDDVDQCLADLTRSSALEIENIA